ncbi:hypothetical protein PanWU01x14_154070 [Parasponia andersonii]|uniref:Uncharacterized protein n=1 Tax=Parasponia andersonii TaxID=3476 RepID=A0A2P5CGX8_PARAD|nr:hypothetical protein PanWU01x14_154070 [Parasponia andersonii]
MAIPMHCSFHCLDRFLPAISSNLQAFNSRILSSKNPQEQIPRLQRKTLKRINAFPDNLS